MTRGAPVPTPRILIVEDDPVVSETLRLYLERAGYAVEVSGNGLEGLERARRPGIALVILDWMLPGLSGQEVCRRLRIDSTVPILMLTARTSEDDRVRGLEGGADDYVPKPFSPREVVARVQALLRRAGSAGRSAPPPVRVGDLELDAFRREARVAGQRLALTPSELRLLETLAQSPGRVYTRDELVARALGPDYDGLERTIDMHVTNLRRKIASVSGQRLIHTVHGVGYRLGVDDDE
jgi:DNA-binding response OmpR family regulator